MDKRSIAIIGSAVLLGTAYFSVDNAYEQAKQIYATNSALHRELEAKDAQISALNTKVKEVNTQAQQLKGQLKNDQQANVAEMKSLQDSINKVKSQLPF